MICLIGRSDILSLLTVPLGSFDVCRATNDSGFHELDIERDGHLVAYENAASLEHRVPGLSVVFPIDLCVRGNRNSAISPWVRLGRGRPIDKNNHLADDGAQVHL